MDHSLKQLQAEGWTVECESPLELRHKDGSFASGQAAYTLKALTYLQPQYITRGFQRLFTEMLKDGWEDEPTTFICFHRDDTELVKKFLRTVVQHISAEKEELPNAGKDGKTHHYISGCDCSISSQYDKPDNMVIIPCIQATIEWMVTWDDWMEATR